MQKDFHYYATYCAAYLSGYSHEESLEIAYSAQFVDECSVTLLKNIKAPLSAATTQLQLEMMDIKTTPVEIQKITRIWASFHFLPYDLYADFPRRRSKLYLKKYRLICKPNSDLLVETVNLAKDRNLQAVGLAMHVLADTWAHSYFAGTPSLVINNTNFQFYEITDEGERLVRFNHNPKNRDDLEKGNYTSSLYQSNENSIMNLGHGRAGHLPDYSFARYRYLPAWGQYEEIVKDNPVEYMKAFGQMVYAMKYLRGDIKDFQKDTYAFDEIAPYRDEIEIILKKRQLIACDDWKALGEKISGHEIPEFDTDRYTKEYSQADDKDDTFIGKFILAALSQKSMVTNRIFISGNIQAGFSIDFSKKGFDGIRDFSSLIRMRKEEHK